VTVRLLNCRASPVRDAQSLRVLARGDAVRVLARESGWNSIAHSGRQCWVAERFISSERPL
jgi:SH3-like domain-containing protein